jgi:hypothetical protein
MDGVTQAASGAAGAAIEGLCRQVAESTGLTREAFQASLAAGQVQVRRSGRTTSNVFSKVRSAGR